MKICECLIIIYGKVLPQWVIRQIGEVRKIIDRSKQKIIYDGPPEQKADLPLDFPDIHLLVCRKGICEVCELKLRNLIHASPGGGIS